MPNNHRLRNPSWAQDLPRTWYGGCNHTHAGIYEAAAAGSLRERHGDQASSSSCFTHKQSQNRSHMRSRSIPAIVSPADYLPVPYVSSKQRTPSVPQYGGAVQGENHNGRLADRLRMPPPPLCILPAKPSMTYNNPRNGLQRRMSPTSAKFGGSNASTTSTPSMSPRSPLTPFTPLSPMSSYSYSTNATSGYKSPVVESSIAQEPVYVVTLKTSAEIAGQMQALRQKWFPADRLKVPAHITLFHALPESHIAAVIAQIETLCAQTSSFEISSGRVVKMKRGVLVHLDEGAEDARRVFVQLRTSWWGWLSEQDKAFKAHWTIQNKEEDGGRVEEAYRETHRLGSALGWATGLVLWRYENDGRWTKERGFEFAASRRGERRDGEGGDGWPVY